jgi:asparagine synthase (glutamine-hydrolysing)
MFPSRNGQAPGMQPCAGGGFLCGAGTWFYEKAAGEEALQRMAASAVKRWLGKVDGAFALAVIDGRGEIRLVTDLLGTLHVYSAEIGPAAVVCTSSIVLAVLADPEWDAIGIREFLATGTVFGSRTLFRGIEKLQPATVFTFRRGRIEAREVYWKLADVMYDRAPQRDVTELAEALRRAVDSVRQNFPRAVMDLTGGFDSRAILGAALQIGARFETVVNGTEENPDVIASKRIAHEFQLVHHHWTRIAPTEGEWEEQVTESLALCDGEYDAVLYAPTFATHSVLAREFDASINGSNGEVAKGYWWELLFPNVGKRGSFDARLVAARRFAVDGETAGLLAEPFQESLTELFAGIIREANAGLEQHPNTAQMDSVYLRLRMQRWQGRIASATGRIWPCISPFSFRGPMEAALAAPPEVRMNNRMQRRLIESQNPKLARLPLAEGYPASPWRLANAHLFGKLYAETARAVIRRALLTAKLPSPFESKKALAAPDPGLCDRQLVRDLLDPSGMITGKLYNQRVLKTVLEQSRYRVAEATLRAQRILTIEMLARTTAKERKA